VIGQVALSFALLVGAGLMIRSFLAMTRADPGYAANELASASIDLPATRYETPARQKQFFDRLFERLASMNGIARAAGIDIMPQTAGNDTYAYPEGSPPEPGTQGFNAQLRFVTPGYFDAMGIPLRRGRTFSAGDVVEGCGGMAACGSGVVIIDEPFAEEIFPGQDAVGRRIVVDLGEPAHVEIVGVVGGVLHWSPADGRFGTMYFPFGASPRASLQVALRAASDADAALAALRAAVAEIDPQLPLAEVNRMSDLLAASVAGPRVRARLLGGFAGAALLLAAAGLYGVLACFVTERRRELGVRLALGADAAGVVRLVVRQGMRLVLLGLAVGVLAAAGMSRALQGLLFGVTASDPVSFGAVGLILAAVALPACLLPAWRATRVDPIEVMRAE
jgi:predicted permease